MYLRTVDPQSDELQAGLEIARQAGAAKLAAERQAEEVRERQAEAQIDAVIHAEMDAALKLYKETIPLYEQRALAAAKLREPMAEFVRIENELKVKRQAARGVLQELRIRTLPVSFAQHITRLREQAGLPDDWDLGTSHPRTESERLADTVCLAIDAGILGPGIIYKAARFKGILDE